MGGLFRCGVAGITTEMADCPPLLAVEGCALSTHDQSINRRDLADGLLGATAMTFPWEPELTNAQIRRWLQAESVGDDGEGSVFDKFSEAAKDRFWALALQGQETPALDFEAALDRVVNLNQSFGIFLTRSNILAGLRENKVDISPHIEAWPPSDTEETT